jgi:diguanylate cyclase (GGDEF)-like protein
MPANSRTVLLASQEAALFATLKLALTTEGDMAVSQSAESALEIMSAQKAPALTLIDETLPGMPTAQLLASVLSNPAGKRFPIVLISNTVTCEWADRLHEGILDDIVPRNADALWWRIRIDLVMRRHRLTQELESLRRSASANAEIDRLTGVYNREGLLAILARETDRVLRQRNPLSAVKFDIDDFGHWNSRLGADACDEILRTVVVRSARILRSYDALGRLGADEFLIVLPGCSTNNALMLAERLRLEVFGVPFRIGRETVRLSACFGISTNASQSPLAMLCEAERAVVLARQTGPESIQCFADSRPPAPPPVTFLSAGSGDDLLVW